MSPVNNRKFPAGVYMLKVNNRNTRTKVWNMSKVNIKDTKTTPMLTLNIFHSRLCSSVSFVNFEHVIADWVVENVQNE